MPFIKTNRKSAECKSPAKTLLQESFVFNPSIYKINKYNARTTPFVPQVGPVLTETESFHKSNKDKYKNIRKAPLPPLLK
jgi:hypothetical protein